MSVLSIQGLRKSFGGVHAVDGVSFDISEGEFLALIGPNGAGKSTCFNMINGQLASDSGEIWFESKKLTGLKPREIWRGILRRSVTAQRTGAGRFQRDEHHVPSGCHAA